MLREVIKLNSARRAFREGRLLDALEMLEDPLIAEHRKAQALRERVIAALKARGGERRDLGELTLALADMEEVAGRRPDDDAKGDGNQIEKMRVSRDEDQARVRALYFKARLSVERGDLAAADLTLSVVPDEARTPEFNALCSEITDRRRDARSAIESVVGGRVDVIQQDAVLDEASKHWALCPDLLAARHQVAVDRSQRALKSQISHGAFVAFLIEHGLYKARHLSSIDALDCVKLDAPLNAEVRGRVDALLEEGRDEAARRLLSRQREHLSCDESDEVLRLGVDDLASARHMLDTGDHSGARSRAECAAGRLGKKRSVRQLMKAIDKAERDSRQLMDRSRQALENGDLDKAREILSELREKYPNHVLARSLEEVIEEKLDARRVALSNVQGNIGEGRIEVARKELLQMRLQGDRSPDISQLLSECAERERELFSLPEDDEGAGIAGGGTGLPRQSVPQLWMLSIEECGEYLVLEQDEILIGNAVGGAADLPIMAPIATRHAVLSRRSGFHDGVVYSITVVDGNEMKVNNHHETSVQLSHGDDVVLGSGLQFQFFLPSPRSRTALLQLEGGLQVEGSRQILLMPPSGRGGAILAGCGEEVHIDVPNALDDIEILRESGSQLLQIRSQVGVAIDGQPEKSQGPLGLGSFFKSSRVSGAIRAVDL